ncbi:MAG: hypothetical protein GOV15_02865, partial [Candidatus Diapherotrites archaeon]|nr:hypothetical protein [Candidatus Diapherotrites archaeon]
MRAWGIFLLLLLFAPFTSATIDDPEQFVLEFDTPDQWEFVCLPKGAHFEDTSSLTKDNITGLKKVDSESNLAFVKVDTAGQVDGFTHVNTTYSKLEEGRNPVCVSPHVVNRSFDDFKGTCDLTRAAYYDDGDWRNLSLTEPIGLD